MRSSQLTLGRQPMFFFFGCSLTTSYPEAPVCHIKKANTDHYLDPQGYTTM